MLLSKSSDLKIPSNSQVPCFRNPQRRDDAISAHSLVACDGIYSLSRLDMEDAIERLFTAGIANQGLVIDVIDALTPSDVSRQEVAFNSALVANEGFSLAGRAPTKSLLVATSIDVCQSDKVSPSRQVSRSFLASAFRQLAAITCYFAAIYIVGVLILAREVGLVSAIPLAIKTCAGKSLVAALIGPWIQRLTGVSTS